MTGVFVSSTYSDLVSYRDVVQKVIRQSGAEAIGMEDFGARDERPLDECLRLIREQADIFIGIYAHRYRYIPHGMPDSISEYEYKEAISKPIPVFAYVVDDDHPWTMRFVDKGKTAERLATFKSNLRKNHIVKTFKEPFELAASVAADLARQNLRNGLVDARVPSPPIESAADTTLKKDSSKSAERRQPPNAGDWNDINADEWNDKRYSVYNASRDVFIHYDVETSSDIFQRFDITMRLVRKANREAGRARDDLSDVQRAEFFFGPWFGNRVHSVDNIDGKIGIIIAAYGEFLAYCRVYFRDGYSADISQFIRFPDEHSE
jgi:hypothetical protein